MTNLSNYDVFFSHNIDRKSTLFWNKKDKQIKQLQNQLSDLTQELRTFQTQKAESAGQERIMAALRRGEFNYSTLNKQSIAYPLFPKPHLELLQKLYILSFNPLANRILQIPVDLLHQTATPFQTENAAEEEVLEKFWDDPVNNFKEFGKRILYEYGLYGEQIYTRFVNPSTKRLRLGYIHPMTVQQTILDPDNDRTVIGIKLRNPDPRNRNHNEILTTVVSLDDNDEDVFSPETRQLRETFLITDPITKQRVKRSCFLFQEKPHYCAGSDTYGISLRGTSDLTYLYDWILSTDDILSSMIERADLLSRTLFTLQVEGGNLRDGDEYNLENLRQKYGKIPERWEVRVTNEKMKYERHDSPGQNSDMVELLRSVQLYVISGCGYPEHWFLGGVNANKASSTNMEYPTLKKLEGRQHTHNGIYETLFTYQVNQAGIEPSFKMVSTPLKDATTQTLAQAMKILSESLGNAEDREWLDSEEATMIYRKLVQELGTKLKDRPKISHNSAMRTDMGKTPEGQDEEGMNISTSSHDS